MENSLTMACHLHLPYIKQRSVRLIIHLEQGVALLQSLVITVQCLDVSVVILRYDDIHQSATLLTSARNKRSVVGRNKNQGYKSQVHRQPLILFFVALEVLLRTALHSAININGVARLILISSVKNKEVFTMRDDLRIHRIGRTATERQIIHGIEKVGLSLTVVSEKAVHLRRQIECCLTNVLEIEYGNFI